MARALADALREEITNRDNVHESLKILDDIVHQLIAQTAPKHTPDEDCGCGKKERHPN